jgi:hypothetical protein
MRLLLHPAALGLALALGAIAVARAITHEPAPPAHLVGHALEVGGLYLIGMTGAALVIASLSPGSAHRWLRPLILYVALGLVAIGAQTLTDVPAEGTPLDRELRELALGWAGLLVVVAVGMWLLPFVNRLGSPREVARDVDERTSAVSARIQPKDAESVPQTQSVAEAEWDEQTLGYVAGGAWGVSSVVMLLFDLSDASGLSVVLLGVLAGGWLLSPFLGALAVGASMGIRHLFRGAEGGGDSAIAMMLAVAFPVVAVVGLTALIR